VTFIRFTAQIARRFAENKSPVGGTIGEGRYFSTAPTPTRVTVMLQDENFTINFLASKELHDDLHAAARQQERSASACVRLALRAWLKKQRLPAQSPQETRLA
jgi:hypothetical protein